MPTRKAPPALVSESQVEAAISLLTDTSDRVVESCRRALLEHAELAESLLRERLARSTGDEAEALRTALVDVVGSRLEAPLIDHLVHAPSLEQGSILIGRLIDASELPGSVTAALDAMADQVAAELASPRRTGRDGTGRDGAGRDGAGRDAGRQAAADSDRELSVLIDVLVRQQQLTGADPSRAEPWDAVLHGVTLRQRGLPLALCVTWLLVARRARLPLHGVNMPGHFVLRWEGSGGTRIIDPYHGGRLVSDEDCRRMLVSSGYPSIDVTLLHATDRDMLLRTLRNLVMIASRRRERVLGARCARILSRTAAIIGA
jgi:hypothetical protein